jgi:hypothetical protein
MSLMSIGETIACGAMLARTAGRLITGPLAFFVAGVIDAGAMLLLYARWRAGHRRAAADPQNGASEGAAGATRPS